MLLTEGLSVFAADRYITRQYRAGCYTLELATILTLATADSPLQYQTKARHFETALSGNSRNHMRHTLTQPHRLQHRRGEHPQ